MLKPGPGQPPRSSEIILPDRYYNRREIMTGLVAAGAVGLGLPKVGVSAELAHRKIRVSA
jgi:hypothetical protein